MYSWILPSGVENANTKDVATAASIPLRTRNTANSRIIGQGCCQAKGVKCLEGCKVYSSEVVREGFLPKVALELGIEERRKSWGMALQSQRQWERLGLLLHTYMKCWSVMFFPQGPTVFFIFITCYIFLLQAEPEFSAMHMDLGSAASSATHTWEDTMVETWANLAGPGSSVLRMDC